MEEHFRKKLKNHRVDWDEEELLDSLKQELSQNKSRFNWRLLLLLPLLFIATCWGLTDSEVVIENSTSSISNSMEKNINTETPTVNPISDSNSNFSNQNLLKNKENKSKFPINSKNSKTIINSNLTKNESNIFSNKNELKIENIISKNINLTSKNIKQTNNFTVPISTIVERETNSANRKNQEEVKLVAMLPKLEILEIPFEMQVQTKLPEPKNAVEVILKKETPRFKNSFFVSSSIEVGAIIHQSTKYATNDLEFLELLLNNEKTESSRILLSSNLSIGYLDQSGWSVQSGLEYNEIRGFFNYKHVKTDTIPTFNETGLYFLNQNADTLFFGHSTSLVRTEERIIRHWNKQPYLSIPLEIGYRHSIGSTNVFGTLGVNYAFAYKFKGRVNQLTQDGTNEIVDNPDFFLKSRLGYKLSIGTEIPIFKRMHLLMNLSFRQNPKLAGVGKEQFYRSFSSGVGLRFSLN